MKKKIGFLVVCLVLVASSALALEFTSPESRKGIKVIAEENIKSRFNGSKIETSKRIALAAINTSSLSETNRNRFKKLAFAIINDAYSKPIPKSSIEKGLQILEFGAKWYNKCSEY